jgi:hypothetical protein
MDAFSAKTRQTGDRFVGSVSAAMMDYAQQAHALETAYRQMWRRYCGVS